MPIIFFLFGFKGECRIRNPFKKPAVIAVSQDKKVPTGKDNVKILLNTLKLSGILNGKIAIINHQFYREGDKVSIFTVENISENKVVLFSSGKKYELILNYEKEASLENDKKNLTKEHYK